MPSQGSLPAPIVVFTRPQAAGNIGALARVMSNFGVTELRLVQVGDRPHDAFENIDWAFAKRGEPILAESKNYKSLPLALDGVHLAIGTSGRELPFDSSYARPLVTPSEAFSTVMEWSKEPQFRWALVFGAEDTGMFDAEAALCQQLIRIPTHEMNSSMNIAMAAGVLLYHWQLCTRGEAHLGKPKVGGAFANPGTTAGSTSTEWANVLHQEAFIDYLMETLTLTDFLKFPDRGAVGARVRRWLQNAMIPLNELLYGFEILYQLRSWGSGKFDKRDFLKPRKES